MPQLPAFPGWHRVPQSTVAWADRRTWAAGRCSAGRRLMNSVSWPARLCRARSGGLRGLHRSIRGLLPMLIPDAPRYFAGAPVPAGDRRHLARSPYDSIRSRWHGLSRNSCNYKDCPAAGRRWRVQSLDEARNQTGGPSSKHAVSCPGRSQAQLEAPRPQHRGQQTGCWLGRRHRRFRPRHCQLDQSRWTVHVGGFSGD